MLLGRDRLQSDVAGRWRARFRETEAVAVGDFDHRH